MALVDEVSRKTDEADLVILAHVETIRDQEQPATASAVASLIGGAPRSEVSRRLHRMAYLGVLEYVVSNERFALSELGAEMMRRELIGWSPSRREERRRRLELLLRASRRV
jgi:hypothetical protein